MDMKPKLEMNLQSMPANDFPLRRRRIVSVANTAVTTERMGMNIYQISFLSCRVAA